LTTPTWRKEEFTECVFIAIGKRVVELSGAKGLGVSSGYQAAIMSSANIGLLGGQLAWRQHDGGRTGAPNVKYFIAWADKFMGRTPPQQQ
jgi:hypothetical protein